MATCSEVRVELRRGDFDHLPVDGKAVVIEKWTTRGRTSFGDIDIWEETWPRVTNTGILTKLAPTLDIDILNPEAAEAVELLVQERVEERGDIHVPLARRRA